jgi:hypothetical protein
MRPHSKENGIPFSERLSLLGNPRLLNYKRAIDNALDSKKRKLIPPAN